MTSSVNDTDLAAEPERVLASYANELAAKGVRAVSLVGSRARGTAKPESDDDPEPPRVCRRLQLLGGWSYGNEIDEIFA